MNKVWCRYFVAQVPVTTTWFVTGVFRSQDHLVFERTMEGQNELLEFFVPEEHVVQFTNIVQHLITTGYITHLEERENRIRKQHEAS